MKKLAVLCLIVVTVVALAAPASAKIRGEVVWSPYSVPAVGNVK